MKSRALIHSKYESRLLGVRQQGSPLPLGLPGTGMTGRPLEGRPAAEQALRQSRLVGFLPQPMRLPKA